MIMYRLFTVFLLGLTVVLAGCTTNEDDLVVGLECNYAPFNWTDNSEGVEIEQANGYCAGYDVTVAQEISDGLDKDLRVRKIDWDGLIPALNSGEIDVIIAGMSPTEERKESVSFTDEYFRSEQVMVVRSDSDYTGAESLEDFEEARVIAQQGTLQDDLIPQIDNVDHASPLNDYPSLVEQVRSGISDAFVAELPVALSVTDSDESLEMVRFEEGSGFDVEDEQITVSVALRKDDTSLRDEINDILASIDEETRQEWMEEALSNQP